MNDSGEELISSGKPSAKTPGGNGQIRAQGAPQERPAATGQSAALAAGRIVTMGDAQRIGRETGFDAGGYAALEADFRAHHETSAARLGGPYEHYRLVYRYGYDLGADARYRDAAWAEVERVARPRWEARNPGTWALFQETIRYAWDTARRHG